MPENSKNKRYLVRAIEQGGVATSQNIPMQGSVIVGLNPGMIELEARVRLRAQTMLENGAIKEAEWLFKTYGYDAPAASAPFFKAYAPFAKGEATQQECLERDSILNRQLAKRQIAWFKRNKNIQWFSKPEEAQNFVLLKFKH